MRKYEDPETKIGPEVSRKETLYEGFNFLDAFPFNHEKLYLVYIVLYNSSHTL